MRKFTRLFGLFALSASIFVMSSCTMISGGKSGELFNEDGKKLVLKVDSWEQDGATHYKWSCSFKTKISAEKGQKYLITFEGTADGEDISWLGIDGYTTPKKNSKEESKEIFTWTPFYATKNDAKSNNFTGVQTFKAGESTIGYIVVEAKETAKLQQLTFDLGNLAQKPTGEKVIKDYSLTVEEF